MAILVLLAACGKKADDALAVVSAPAAAPVTGAGTVIAVLVGARAGNANDQTTKKLNAYTGACNKLIGTFGLIETRKGYFEKNIAKRTSADSISITDGWIEGALDQFKKSRALPASGPDALDPTVDTLIGALTSW